MPSPIKIVGILAWAKMWEVEVEQSRILVPKQFSLEQRAGFVVTMEGPGGAVEGLNFFFYFSQMLSSMNFKHKLRGSTIGSQEIANASIAQWQSVSLVN